MSVCVIEGPAGVSEFFGTNDDSGLFLITGAQATTHAVVAAANTLEVDDESVGEILSAGMDPSGLARAFGSLALMRPWGPFEEFAMATDDHGITLEFSRPDSSKEAVVVIPRDGSTAYFTARANNNFRKAGVILDDLGVQSLGSWVASETTEFSEGGLQVASGQEGRRPKAGR